MPPVASLIRLVRRVLIALAMVYLGMTLMLMAFERSMIYPAPPRDAGEWNPTWLDYEEVSLSSRDGTALHGWYLPHPDPVATLLFCHGNGEHLGYLAEELDFLRQRLRVNVMAIDYRGYGKSGGTPFEQGVLADGEAAQRWLAERTNQSPEDIVLYGRSLGGAVCVHLAATEGARGLMVDRTFGSMVDVAALHMRWLPVRWLLRNRYPSQSRIQRYKGPLLQIHGEADEIVPIEIARKLFDASPSQQKTWIAVPALGHNSPWPEKYYHDVDTFIRSLP